MNYKVPILVLFWDRPSLIARLLNILQEVRPEKIYLASDGPISTSTCNQHLVSKSRELSISLVNWSPSLKTRFLASNLGCRAAVASAINWFFEHEEEGIILEDDVHPVLSFFPYMQELLKRYRHDNRVGSISSHNFHRQPIEGVGSYQFSIYTHCWGWASWRRAWSQYDYHLSTWPAFRDRGLLAGLGDSSFQKYWTRLLDAMAREEIDTWDFAWTYSHWKAGMLSCVPDRCLVENAGFGPDATHTNAEVCPLPAPQPMTFPLRHPQFVRPSPFHDRLTQRFQYCQPSPLERLQRKWRRWRLAT